MTLNSNTNRSRHPSSCAATPAGSIKRLPTCTSLTIHGMGLQRPESTEGARDIRDQRDWVLSQQRKTRSLDKVKRLITILRRFESGPTWTNTQCSCWSNRKLLVDCSSGTTHQKTLTKQRKQSVCWRFDEFVRHVFSRRLLVFFFSMIDVTWYYYSRSNEWSASQPIGIECPRYQCTHARNDKGLNWRCDIFGQCRISQSESCISGRLFQNALPCYLKKKQF